MIKYTKLTLTYIFLILIFATSVKAFEFIKSDSNPLPLTYSFGYSQQLQAHIYKDGSKYRGILTAKRINESHHSLVSIESSTGIEWFVNKEILNIGKDVDGRLFIDKNMDRKIVFAKMDSNDFYRIYEINCDQNLNCDQNPNLVLDNSPSDPSESHGVFGPHILYINEEYFLFYGTWGNKGFITKLAHSDHFGNWQKCEKEISLDADSPFAYVKDDSIYLFVHGGTGIRVLRTDFPLSCNSTWENLGYAITKGDPYDQNIIIFPSIVETSDNNIGLYYSGKGQDNVWRLNMAIETSLPIPTSTPTPTPTSTPSPTPTLTPTPTYTPTPTPEKIPIVLIPGAMSSWNKEAVLHNKTVDQSEWSLLPFVKEYQGLINTLTNLGYKERQNLFVFAYDWRKPMVKSAEDLKNYLENSKINDKKFNFVGHSLGGLVARSYAQMYSDTNLNKLLTIGSPHRGVTQAYKAVEGGEIEQDNSWLWLAQKLILQLYGKGLKTDRQVLNESFPVARELLPTFNYLTDQNGNEVDIFSMSVKNDYLSGLAENFQDIFPLLQTINGRNINTVRNYKIVPRSILDQLLNNYPDGRPIEVNYDSGDGLVLAFSAKTGNSSKELDNFNHGEVVYKKDAIKEILRSLDIPYVEEQIREGVGTKISPSIIFIIKSPALMEVKHEDDLYQEYEGVILIENAESGKYELNVKGIDRGRYEIIIGEIGTGADSWNNIHGEITSLIPQLETDTFTIDFKNDNPDKFFVDKDNPLKLIDELISLLKINEKKNREIIRDLNKAKTYYAKNKMNSIAKVLIDQDEDLIEKSEFEGLAKLENIYGVSIKGKSWHYKSLSKRVKSLTKLYVKKQNKLLKKNNLKNKNLKMIILDLINKKIELVKVYMTTKEYAYAEITLKSISNLLRKL